MLEYEYKKIYYQHAFNFKSDNLLAPRHSIYSIDRKNSILRKLNNSRMEVLKELIIHDFSSLTLAVKEIL